MATDYDGRSPIHYCTGQTASGNPCTNVIGDGDWSQQGHRLCVPCRRPSTYRPSPIAEQLVKLTLQQVLNLRARPRR